MDKEYLWFVNGIRTTAQQRTVQIVIDKFAQHPVQYKTEEQMFAKVEGFIEGKQITS